METLTVTVAANPGFQSGDTIEVTRIAPPRFSYWRIWQDGDLKVFRWLYRAFGLEWERLRSSRYIVTFTSATTLTIR